MFGERSDAAEKQKNYIQLKMKLVTFVTADESTGFSASLEMAFHFFRVRDRGLCLSSCCFEQEKFLAP